MTLPLGIRHNNPGNIRITTIPWQGKSVGPEDSGFEYFDAPIYGLRAMMINIINYQKKHGLNSIETIISRYAPPSENNTQKYITDVAAWTGLDPLKHYNFSEFGVLVPVIRAMVRKECGAPTKQHMSDGYTVLQWYPDRVYNRAYKMATGRSEELPEVFLEPAEPNLWDRFIKWIRSL